MLRLFTFLIGASTALGACAEREAAAAPPAHRPTHVDSILPRAEALRRFQASARPADGLAHGVPSRDALVHAFVRALETRDTAGLRALALTRDEYAFLYYPTASQGLPPYDLPPDLLWFMLQSASDKGLTRLLAARAGGGLGYERYRCDPEPSREGANLLWGPCLVRHRRGGRMVTERLFGLVIERAGQFKFVSYGNKL